MQTGPLDVITPALSHEPASPSYPSRQELSRAVAELNAATDASSNRELSISIDQQTQQPVVRVLDSASGEVMGQVPLEYVPRIADLLAAEKEQVNAARIS